MYLIISLLGFVRFKSEGVSGKAQNLLVTEEMRGIDCLLEKVFKAPTYIRVSV